MKASKGAGGNFAEVLGGEDTGIMDDSEVWNRERVRTAVKDEGEVEGGTAGARDDRCDQGVFCAYDI